MKQRPYFSPLSSSHVWPGFVDALSALLTVILFAFMIFVVSYVYLYGMMQKKEFSLESSQKTVKMLEERIAQERKAASLQQDQLQQLQKMYHELKELLKEKESRSVEASQTLENQAQVIARKDQDIEVLKQKLQDLLAKKIKELSGSRSEFFGKLKKALGKRKDVRLVGDRFIFQSEVLFDLGSATVNAKGKKELASFAQALKEATSSIPEDVSWVLRVDGHTDDLPIRPGGKFLSNLELSTARAIAVVNFLIEQGMPAHLLAAAGFGEFRPLSPGQHTAKDRRIELMLDQGY